MLDFWFGPPDSPQHGQPRAEWFRKDPAFDAQIAQRFGRLVRQALAGALDHWVQPLAALPGLALVVVLDQFTRNTGRDRPAAFAGDARALALATALVDAGMDRALIGVHRQFLYLPFEHAEDLAVQQRSVRLFTQLAADAPAQAGLVDWAQRHLDIVARFGRFPPPQCRTGPHQHGRGSGLPAHPGLGLLAPAASKTAQRAR